MIETRNLTKRYGKLTAVDRLSLKVGEGELFGFVGPNGAGKTTTIQILATLLEPTAGSALIGGMDVRRMGREVRRIIGYMPDFFGLYESLRVREYLEFFAAAYDVPRVRRSRLLEEVLELTDLTVKRDAMVGELSRGMQQRLGLARVLIHDPKVLLLDEPASGLDPRARVEVREILKELRGMGKTILISSHILSELAEVCTSIGIIERGRLVVAGPVEEVLARAGFGNSVRVRVEGEVEGAMEALKEMTGVKQVEEEEGEIRVLLESGRDGVPEVAALLVSRGFRLRHLEAEQIGLEEAYLRLTEGVVS
jgi:ABC-2 type transport system ATP-binding protein